MSMQIGQHYETMAKRYLKKQGCKIITHSYRTSMGEIDLVILDHLVLAFVEVKFRQNDFFGNAMAAVTTTKQQRIIRAAQHYLGKYTIYDTMESRFDVVAIDGKDRITWLKSAFTL